MDKVSIYQVPHSRDPEDFYSDIRDGAIETAFRYIQERIASDLKDEARIFALEELASELALDDGNRYIVAEIRARIILEKRALNMMGDSLLV